LGSSHWLLPAARLKIRILASTLMFMMQIAMSEAARSTGAVPCRDPKIERAGDNPAIVREMLDCEFGASRPIHATAVGARARS